MLMDRWLAFSSSNAALRRALHLIARRQHQTAIKLLARAAKAGNAVAAYRLGRCYLEGEAVPASETEAIGWLEHASSQGVVEAQSLLATLYLRGVAESPGATGADLFVRKTVREPNYQAALKWALQAADAGSGEAQAVAAYVLSFGPASMRDLHTAEDLYARSAASGCPQGILGQALSKAGRAASYQDWEDVMRLLKQVKEVPTAAYVLGLLYRDGKGTPRDVDLAVTHLRFAAKKGHCAAQAALGRLLIEGVQVERDLITGESWLRRAAAAGDHEAARSIAELYLSPGPLPPNVTEGANWLRRAAELGDKIAARKLADLYFTGTELGYDPQEGARWLVASAETGMPNPAIIEDFRRQFEDAACQGDPVAAFNLAICLMEGWGTEQNKMEAENWLRKSAEYLPQAQYVYGRMLAQGDGAEPDLHAARAWLTRAAKAGFTEAQAALAEMMLNGRGGPASPVQAKSLFEQAAAQQHVGAMFALGAMHSGGHGIPIDLEAAKKWLTAAAERGHLRAEDSLARLSTSSGASGPSQNAG